MAGVQAALQDHPDVIVLDLMLPKMDGLAVCREIREKAPYIPILMLTAKDDVVDKVLGLEMGADDYITKPFVLRELEARIKSVLRRARTPETESAGDEAPIGSGKCVDPSRRESRSANDRRLTPTSLPDVVRSIPEEFPAKYLWKISGYSYEGTTQDDSHINRLRARRDNPKTPPWYDGRGIGTSSPMVKQVVYLSTARGAIHVLSGNLNCSFFASIKRRAPKRSPEACCSTKAGVQPTAPFQVKLWQSLSSPNAAEKSLRHRANSSSCVCQSVGAACLQ